MSLAQLQLSPSVTERRRFSRRTVPRLSQVSGKPPPPSFGQGRLLLGRRPFSSGGSVRAAAWISALVIGAVFARPGEPRHRGCDAGRACGQLRTCACATRSCGEGARARAPRRRSRAPGRSALAGQEGIRYRIETCDPLPRSSASGAGRRAAEAVAAAAEALPPVGDDARRGPPHHRSRPDHRLRRSIVVNLRPGPAPGRRRPPKEATRESWPPSWPPMRSARTKAGQPAHSTIA